MNEELTKLRADDRTAIVGRRVQIPFGGSGHLVRTKEKLSRHLLLKTKRLLAGRQQSRLADTHLCNYIVH